MTEFYDNLQSQVEKDIITAELKAAGITKNLLDICKNKENPIKDNHFK